MATTPQPPVDDGSLPPLPFGPEHWQQVVEVMELSPRQANIAELMVRGAQLKQIAAELGIKACTVRGQQDRMYVKLGIRGTKEFFIRVLGISYRVSCSRCSHK